MQRRSSGFTIVELLIVIVVIAILAAITVVAYNGIRERARDSERHSEVLTIRKKLEEIYTLTDAYPQDIFGGNGVTVLGLTLDQLSGPGAEGLGVRIGYANQHFNLAYKYVAINQNGTQCGGSEVCKGYVLGYWAVGENRDYEYRNLQGRTN